MNHRNAFSSGATEISSFAARSRNKTAASVTSSGWSAGKENQPQSCKGMDQHRQQNPLFQSPPYDGRPHPNHRTTPSPRQHKGTEDSSPPFFSHARSGGREGKQFAPGLYTSVSPSSKPGPQPIPTPRKKRSDSEQVATCHSRITPDLVAPTPSPVQERRSTSSHPLSLEEQYLRRQRQQHEDEVMCGYEQRYQVNSLQLQCESLVSLSERQSKEISDVKDENAMLRDQLKTLSARYESALTQVDQLSNLLDTSQGKINNLENQLGVSQEQNQHLLLQCNSAATSLTRQDEVLNQLKKLFTAQHRASQVEISSVEVKLSLLLQERSGLLDVVAQNQRNLTETALSNSRESRLALQELDRLERSALTATREHQRDLERLHEEKELLQKRMGQVASQCDKMAATLEVTSMERAKSRTPPTCV